MGMWCRGGKGVGVGGHCSGKGIAVKALRCQIAGMATLTIRNLPDELHLALKERTKRNRRSLNQEVIAELAAVPGDGDDAARLAASRERMARALEAVDEARMGMTRFMSAEEIDAAKREGRA